MRCDFELYNLHLCHRCWKSRAAHICLTDTLWKLGSQSGCSIPTSAVLCMLGMGRQYIREYKCMLRPHSALGIEHSVRRVRGCRGPPSRSLSVGLLKGNGLVSIHTQTTCISTMQKGMGPMCSMKPTLDAHTQPKTEKLYATRFHSLPSTSKSKFFPAR